MSTKSQQFITPLSHQRDPYARGLPRWRYARQAEVRHIDTLIRTEGLRMSTVAAELRVTPAHLSSMLHMRTLMRYHYLLAIRMIILMYRMRGKT